MCSSVPLELITTGKPLATKHPSTNKWTLSRMPAEMSSQMWCFSIYFSTTRYVTDVLFLFPQTGAPVKWCIKTKLLNIFLPAKARSIFCWTVVIDIQTCQYTFIRINGSNWLRSHHHWTKELQYRPHPSVSYLPICTESTKSIDFS